MVHSPLAIADNLLEGVRQCPSPNSDQRPPNTDIDLLVIHNISLPEGVFGTPYIEQLFCNSLDCEGESGFADLAGLRVSAHLLIDRNGLITQFVPFNRRAWHAGKSSFEGRTACNDFSIGIELEGSDDKKFEGIQYDQLAHVTTLLMREYSCLNRDRIVGHSDIAPSRKTDPGPFFDWSHYRALLDA